jgi:Putative MetA-pathway of phenol degradation
MPSGSEARGLGSGQIGGFLPIWLSKEFNQWTVFGGGGYNINPGIDRLNWWFTGLGVTRELTPKWTVGVELFHTTPTDRDAKDNTAFNVGAIYNISDEHHLMVSVGRNLTNARENNEFTVYIGYQLTL